jgi:hypothetical protein
MEGGHTFSPLSFCSRSNPSSQAASEMRATAMTMAQEVYTSHNPPFAVHSNHVCGKMNMGSHECIWLQLIGHQGRKVLEIHTPKT